MSDYEEWIGREFEAQDRITPRMLREFRATLPGLLGPGEVPAGFHWCLSPEALDYEHLGRDGHPQPGIFLPKLPLPRRMWAGGEIEVIAPLHVEDTVHKSSVIRKVTFKQGRSGDLGFVEVDHSYSVDGAVRIRERQDLVYRADPDPDRPAPEPPQAADWDVIESWTVSPDPVMLFRYSALTFNGHRIHYDGDYARTVEGYDGLVVHGPMQSVWMQNLAAQILGRQARFFRYRGLSPLTVGYDVKVEARREDDILDLRVRRRADNVVTMSARAEL
ncbi:MaoC family dehydratase N-terminal domain-containing protein [Pseudooceanicola sp. LIPI14-2-Ac024]|uniref:FAS1-like dehydratase domain-containing protein n=1 Tax=Pseudooceanicola sp. LIPI14-2-Ac024 TaxID=3344875 RepID=UPI0035CF89CE